MYLFKALLATLVIVAVLGVILFLFYEAALLPLGKTINYDGFLTVMITALGVMVAIFAIMIGLAAIWGYAGLRDVVRETATKEVAKAVDVLQLSGRLAGDVKESPNGNPTRDLQMAADRTRPHTLCGPVVSSLFSFAARC